MSTCKGIFSIINLVLLENLTENHEKVPFGNFDSFILLFSTLFLWKMCEYLKFLVKIHIFALYEDLQRNRNIFLCKMHQIIVFMMKFTWFSVGKRIQILWKNWSVFSSTWNDKLLRKQAFFNGISLWMWVLTFSLYW